MQNRRLVAIIAFLALAACSKKEERGTNKFLLPWPTEQGTYELQVVEINTLRDLKTLSGDAAQIFIEPSIEDDGPRGSAPHAHFAKTQDDVLVPKDFMSSQLAGLYAHAEKLSELDAFIGVKGLISYPKKYGVKARVYQDGEFDFMKNNATYVSDAETTLIMPYEGDPNNPSKQLPIPLNAGVLAHEHFHVIFAKMMSEVLKNTSAVDSMSLRACNAFSETGISESLPLSNKPKKNSSIKSEYAPSEIIHNTLVIRGINEGLADFWGWVYTGDDSFISHSLPVVGKTRILTNKAEQEFISTDDFYKKSLMYSSNSKVQLSYELGTQVARVIRRSANKLVENWSPEDAGLSERTKRLKLAKAIFESLPELKKSLEKQITSKKRIETTTFNDVLFSLSTKKKFDSKDCEFIEKSLSAEKAAEFKEKSCE